jgi:hypothetical protein
MSNIRDPHRHQHSQHHQDITYREPTTITSATTSATTATTVHTSWRWLAGSYVLSILLLVGLTSLIKLLFWWISMP